MRTVLVLLFILAPVALFSVLIWNYAPDSREKLDPAIASCKGKPSAANFLREIRTKKFRRLYQAIAHALQNCERRIEIEGVEAVLPYFDATLEVIEGQQGRNSAAYVMALNQIVFLLRRTVNRFDLMRPYSETRMAVARKTYGTRHRQTANALSDHAEILIELNADGSLKTDAYAEDAIPLLREAVNIRRRVLGADHEETVEAEEKLALMLLLKWKRADNQDGQEHLLKEAKILADHAAAMAWRKYDTLSLDLAKKEALLGRIVHAQGNHHRAATYFKAALPQDNVTKRLYCLNMWTACEDYIAALHKLGREEDAAEMEQVLRDAL